MLTVPEALQQILDTVQPLEPTRMPLHQALGLVLTEYVLSREDSPPFHKSLMDGFAIRSEDASGGRGGLKILETITAGDVPTKPLGRGEATQIMTGAPLPEGCDAVIKIEDTQVDAKAGIVRFQVPKVEPGANVMFRGGSVKRGDVVVAAGRVLRPQEIGALAEAGAYEIPVRRTAKVSVLSTGNELVTIDKTPGPGQIRNSNEIMLAAQITRAGAQPVPLGIARDVRQDLRERIQAGLQADLLILSGGVSAGTKDLVPSELQAAGVRQVFHQVKMKPGKPVWFGVLEKPGQAPRYVFGLPGNPVSSMACFEVFVRTALRRLAGLEPATPVPVRMELGREHLATKDRPTYHPGRIEWTEGKPVVFPVGWQGSSDLRATVDANCLVLFPERETPCQPGELLDVFPWW